MGGIVGTKMGRTYTLEDLAKYLDSKFIFKVKFLEKKSPRKTLCENLSKLKNQEDVRMYIFQEDTDGKFFPVFFWLDIDLKNFDEVMRIKEFFPEPNFLCLTGRHYAFLWEINNATEEDWENFKMQACEILKAKNYNEIADEMKSKSPLNAMIRLPETINSKTMNVVEWQILREEEWDKEEFFRELSAKFSNINIQFSSDYPLQYCNLSKILWENFNELKYEGWRFLSYAVIAEKEKSEDYRREFILRSYEWERIHGKGEQSPEYRLQFSLSEYKNKKIAFFSCKSLSSFSTDELSYKFFHKFEFKKHPCQDCPFKNSYKKPFFHSLKPLQSQEIMLQDNTLFYRGQKISENFSVDQILIDEAEKTYYFIVGEKKLKIDIRNDNDLLFAFQPLVSISKLRKVLFQFMHLNPHLIEEIPFTSGYENSEWKILYLHYYLPVISDALDVSIAGDEELYFKHLKALLDYSRYDFAMPILIGTALRFIEKDYLSLNIIPCILIKGKAGIGKTVRLKLLNFLIRKPVVSNFFNFSPAFLTNFIPRIKAFLTFDEFSNINLSTEYQNALLALLNISQRFTAKGIYISNTSPIILAGETKNIINFSPTFRRRIFVINLLEKIDNIFIELLKDIFEKPAWGYFFKIQEKFLEKLKETPQPILPNDISHYQEHIILIKKALQNFIALLKVFGLTFDVESYLEKFLQDNFNIEEMIEEFYRVASFIIEKFSKTNKQIILWNETHCDNDVLKLIFCDEFYKTTNRMGKQYPFFKISRHSPILSYFTNIYLNEEQKNEISRKIDERLKILQQNFPSLITDDLRKKVNRFLNVII